MTSECQAEPGDRRCVGPWAAIFFRMAEEQRIHMEADLEVPNRFAGELPTFPEYRRPDQLQFLKRTGL